jgi:[CysO sulfur-carrier protein]-S-L-cysteine hydrolase
MSISAGGRRGVQRSGTPSLSDVLTIARAHIDAMIAHARADYPDEACGVVVGPEGSDSPERYVKMTNAERSPTFFQFDSGEQLALYKELDANEEEIVVVYHSHTFTEAYPSRTDIGLAVEPQAHYVLVSLADDNGADVPVRSYRILDGQVSEEEIRITE